LPPTRRRFSLGDVLIRVLPALAAGAALLAAAVGQAGAHRSAGPALLPDLDQEAPANLIVTLAGSAAHPVYQLGFRSAVRNVGAGPLNISGSRHDGSVDTMVADQAIVRRGSPQELLRGIGRLRYVVSPDHRHWHLLGFEHYELRRPNGGAALVHDRKTGFCLGDRYEVHDRVLPAKPATKRYVSRCGLGEPGLLGISEGISVGYGDAYAAVLEGQYLPLTGVKDGRYLLVHRVNVNRRIRESDYTNDAASVLLDVHWISGVPHVTELKVCPDSARCPTGTTKGA
jgi:hypothetical protein